MNKLGMAALGAAAAAAYGMGGGLARPRTWKQLNKWLLANGYGYRIVAMREAGLPVYYGGWHRYVDDVEGYPQPFGESVMWYTSSVYALGPNTRTYQEWVEALRDLSRDEEVWWGSTYE